MCQPVAGPLHTGKIKSGSSICQNNFMGFDINNVKRVRNGIYDRAEKYILPGKFLLRFEK